MTCLYCGATIEYGLETCPVCGKKQPAPRRAVSTSGDAAQRYRSRMQARTSERITERPVVRDSRGAVKPPIRKTPASDPPKERRNASERPSERQRKPPQQQRAGSMPPHPKSPPPRAPQAASTPPRMVRRHEYQAIRPDPQGYENFNWMRMLVVSLLCITILTVGVYLVLKNSSMGQEWLASMGRNATAEAYHNLGRRYMAEGSISRAVRALEVAQSKDPNNLELLLDLGKAYMGNNSFDSAELAFSRAIQFYPAHPDAYRLLYGIMIDQSRKFEALHLLDMAVKNNGDDYFELEYNRLIPATPTVSKLGTSLDTETEITLDCEEGAIIYYSLHGKDPLGEEGIEYDGGPIFLGEGLWKLRAVAEKDSMYSRETVQTYTINKPTPDMPRATLAPNTYETVKTVSLRAGEEVVAIYYTIDGTAPSDGTNPTVNAKKFEDPITLRIGWTTLRAVAVNADGKISNELSVRYKCGGKAKNSMEEKDVIDTLSLYKTTRSDFIAAYGEPLSEQADGIDVRGTYTRLLYPFGYAVFLTRGEGSDPVLAELMTNSSVFSAPRGTAVGSRVEDVLNAFRDEGGEDNGQGNRTLYNLSTGRMGRFSKTGEGAYTISYFCKLDNGQYIELTYHAQEGLITSIEWLRYDIN